MAHIANVPERVELLDSETRMQDVMLRLVGERLEDHGTEDPGIGSTALTVCSDLVHPARGGI